MKCQTCPICDGTRLYPFLQRAEVPVHQHLLMPSQTAAVAVSRAELDFVMCEDCGFVFNQAFDLSRLHYGEEYDNTQSCSPYFDTYLDALVRDMVERQGVKNCTIVEVGCGKGNFLRKLVCYPNANNIGYGFDPSYVGPKEEIDGRLQFRTCNYDHTCTAIPADMVICRHVIEHVPNPLQLLRSIRAALSSSPNARVFFETPCVEWILHNRVIWDFFYEHCSLFTAESLKVAFCKAGFIVERADHIFNGQYLWLEARRGRTRELATAYAANERAVRQELLVRLKDLNRNGKVALWGAGAKGATFANLIAPENALIDCVVDLNPNKQGRFIPGTGHPIVAPEDLPRRNVTSAVVMNKNYRNEILDLITSMGLKLHLIDWSE